MTPLLFWFLLLLIFLWIGFILGSTSSSVATVESSESVEADPALLAHAQSVLEPIMVITGRRTEGPVVAVEGKLKTSATHAHRHVEEALEGRQLQSFLQEGDSDTVVFTLVPGKEPSQPDRPNWWLHWTLFLLTFLTTTWAGAFHAGVNLLEQPERIAVGLPYSIGLLLILGAHELGHYFTARRHGLSVTPPFFIPVPFALGTFGAFIKMKSVSPTRRALFDVAVAGPLAGLVFAVPALFYGITQSQLIDGTAPPSFGMHGGSVEVGSSVLMAVVSKLALGGSALEGHQLVLHPLAFAGWLGLLVTALNLLPIGQLDGGHMAHALFGSRKAHSISIAALVSLFMLAFFVWPGLMMWAIIVFFIAGTRDVPAANDVTPVGLPRRLVGFATFAILLAILLPVPHSMYKAFGLYCPYL